MKKYQRLDGTPTAKDDPARGVWYSSRCTFWTDEWDLLALRGHYRLPVCPHCGCPGFQATAADLDIPEDYETKYPGYTASYMALKNAKCQPITEWTKQWEGR